MISFVSINLHLCKNLSYAQKASDLNEVPIGAVIVRNNQVIAAAIILQLLKIQLQLMPKLSY